jgi:transcriptional regulator with XRE-family HTH domain
LRDDMTGSQLRAARGLLGWSAMKLSENSGVSWSTIQRYETRASDTVRGSRSRDRVKLTLEAHGIAFMDDKTQWIGVGLMCPR